MNNFICKICDKQFIFEKNKMDHEIYCDARCNLNSYAIKQKAKKKDNSYTYSHFSEDSFCFEDIIKNIEDKYLKRIELLENKVKYLLLCNPTNRSICEFLKYENKPLISFNKWICSICVTEDTLDLMFNDGIEDTFKDIFKSLLKKNDIPIKSCTIKKKTFYVYDDEKWQTMKDDHFNKIVLFLNKEFINVYIKWSIDNKDEIYNSEKKIDEKIQKMSLINTSDSKKLKYIKKCFNKCVIDIDTEE
jgi:hypothetical protein